MQIPIISDLLKSVGMEGKEQEASNLINQGMAAMGIDPSKLMSEELSKQLSSYLPKDVVELITKIIADGKIDGNDYETVKSSIMSLTGGNQQQLLALFDPLIKQIPQDQIPSQLQGLIGSLKEQNAGAAEEVSATTTEVVNNVESESSEMVSEASSQASSMTESMSESANSSAEAVENKIEEVMNPAPTDSGSENNQNM